MTSFRRPSAETIMPNNFPGNPFCSNYLQKKKTNEYDQKRIIINKLINITKREKKNRNNIYSKKSLYHEHSNKALKFINDINAGKRLKKIKCLFKKYIYSNLPVLN